jgi:hypothetical protein
MVLYVYIPLSMWCDCFWTNTSISNLLSLNTVDSTNCNVQCNSTKTSQLCGSTNYVGNSVDVYAYVYQITNSSNYITTSLLIQILLFSNWFIIFLL